MKGQIIIIDTPNLKVKFFPTLDRFMVIVKDDSKIDVFNISPNQLKGDCNEKSNVESSSNDDAGNSNNGKS